MNKVIKVDKVKLIKTDRYSEGNFFLSGNKLYVLVNGSIKEVQTIKPNMSEYVKKSELDHYLKEKGLIK